MVSFYQKGLEMAKRKAKSRLHRMFTKGPNSRENLTHGQNQEAGERDPPAPTIQYSMCNYSTGVLYKFGDNSVKTTFRLL